MKIWPYLFLFIVANFCSCPALAQTRTVVPDIGTLKSSTSPLGPLISVTCYYNGTTSNNICSGGGDFDRATSCGTDTNNDATIIQDSATPKNCYYRKNFGLNNVADARQCGIHADGMTDDYALLASCLVVAAGLKIPVVSTGGGNVVLAGSTNLDIPSGVWLDCGGTSGGMREDNDYTLTGGITSVIAFPSTMSITGANDNAGLRNCILERSDGTDPPTTFAPTNLRNALDEVSGFAGTAIKNTSEAFQVQNVLVLGFDTCYAMDEIPMVNQAKRPVVDHFYCDGNQFSVNNSPDNTQFDDVTMISYLTRNNGKASSNSWQIDNLLNVSGQYEIVAEIPATGSGSITLQNGDTLWVSLAAANKAQSAEGRWVASSVSNTSCSSIGTCQTAILTGSQTAPTSTTGNWASGASAITGIAASLSLVATGQTVTGTCFPANTFVGDTWPAQHIVFLVQSDMVTPQATTCAGAGSGVTFTDTAFFSNGLSTVTMSSVQRRSASGPQGGILIQNSGGTTFNNCHIYSHDVEVHMYTGANLTRFVNCSIGLNSEIPDPSMVGLLCDDDCGNFDWTNGVLGQFTTNAIRLDTSDSSINRIVNAAIGPGIGRKFGTAFDIEQGNLSIANSGTSLEGNAFVASGTRLSMSNVIAPSIDLYLQDGALASTAAAAMSSRGRFRSPARPRALFPCRRAG